jgi:hypothetical protein
MPPKAYTPIPTNCYLFGKTDKPEEQVRQWVLFELLGTYGYNISQLKVEKPNHG